MGRWRHRSGPRTVAPLLRERWDGLWHGSGFGRTLLLRRAAAAVLVGVAAVLALTPGRGSAVAVIVAARDLAPGTVLEASEVTMRAFRSSDLVVTTKSSIDEAATPVATAMSAAAHLNVLSGPAQLSSSL